MSARSRRARAVASAARPSPPAATSALVDDREERLHLLDLEGRRRGRRGVAIAPHGSPAARPSRAAWRWNERIAARRWAVELRAAGAEVGEVRAEVGPRRASPVDPSVVQPLQVGPDRGLV